MSTHAPIQTTIQSPPSFPGAQRRRLGIILLAILFLAVAASTLYSQYRRTLTLERAVIVREAAAVIGAVEAGINVHARQSTQYIEGRLHDYLEQLVETSSARAIVLATQDGRAFMSAGEAALLADPEQWTEVQRESAWEPHQGCALFHRPMAPLDEMPGLGPGRTRRGRDQWVDLPSGPFQIAVAMDVADLTVRLSAARLRFAASLAGLALVALLASLAYALWERRRSLQTQLWQAHEQTAQLERLAQLGAGLAHETRNPLGVVRGLLQSIAAGKTTDDALRRTLAAAIDEVDRTVGRINSFLQLARPVEPRLESVALAPLLEEVAQLLRPEAPSDAAIETTGADPELTIQADPDMLRRALFNLGLNSLRALGNAGQVRFEVQRQSDQRIAIQVIDNGKGIAPEDLPHVTEPYFTRSAQGSGLGLAIVERLARAHGWQLRIASEPGQGTRVSLTDIPLYPFSRQS